MAKTPRENEKDLLFNLDFDCKAGGLLVDEEVELRCLLINSKFEYEMELPPNCIIKVNAQGNEMTYITNSQVAQRRKDLPVPIKHLLKPRAQIQQVSIIV